MENHIGLIYKVLNDYGIDDELIDIGYIALVEAYNSFDKSKGYKFSTYAYQCIKNKIIKELNRINNDNHKASILHYSLDNYEDESLYNIIGYEEDFEKNIILEEYIKNLEEKSKYPDKKALEIWKDYVCSKYYGKYKANEFLKKWNISKSYLSKISIRYRRISKSILGEQNV